jgi:hypothetical protein
MRAPRVAVVTIPFTLGLSASCLAPKASTPAAPEEAAVARLQAIPPANPEKLEGAQVLINWVPSA